MCARAALIATSTASLPELQNRIVSTDSTRSVMISASSISRSVGIAKQLPRRTCSTIASTTSGWACPWMRVM